MIAPTAGLNQAGFDAIPTRFMRDPWWWEHEGIRLRVWWYVHHERDWATGQGTRRGFRRMAADLAVSIGKCHRAWCELAERGHVKAEAPRVGRATTKTATWPIGVKKPATARANGATVHARDERTVHARDERTYMSVSRSNDGVADRGGVAARPCPKPGCGGRLQPRTNPNDGRPFWGCSNYPNCRHTENRTDTVHLEIPNYGQPPAHDTGPDPDVSPADGLRHVAVALGMVN